jgi:hypothetical protein
VVIEERQSSLARLRRQFSESIITDVLSGREIARLPGVCSLSPELIWAASAQGGRIDVHRIDSGPYRCSWRQA